MTETSDRLEPVPAEGHVPERTCLVTRTHAAPDDLIRFVRDPTGMVVADLRRKLPGRGAWVGARHHLVGEAVRRQAFARSFKQQAAAATALADDVAALLRRDVVQALALANKAGEVVCGQMKVEAAISAGAAHALVQASDASDDGRERMRRRYHAACRETDRPETICETLTVDEMSLALGRLNVVHAALIGWSAARLFATASERLRRYGTNEPLREPTELSR
ncbi:MAG: RNA-binding protein [Hyphomicrobiaceae bacterium]